MKDEENTVVERIYTLPLLDEENTVTLSFNLYQYGSDLLEQATVLLGQEELQTYADAMAQMFGEATEEYERSYFFTSGDVTMILADPYGDGAYIEISADSQ